MNVDGKDVDDDQLSPLAELDTHVIVEQLGRFLTAALAATIPRRSDCWP
jgi:hypothetical protein